MHPALALLELDSIAAGIRCGDAMVKRSPVELLSAGTVHPGKYLLVVAGTVAHVEEARAAALDTAANHLLDEMFLPFVDPQVLESLAGRRPTASPEALGVVESRACPGLVAAADRAVKSAAVTLQELRLADALGGKAYCLLGGSLTDVEAAMEAATATLRPDHLVAAVVIPQLHAEMRQRLEVASTLAPQLTRHSEGGTP